MLIEHRNVEISIRLITHRFQSLRRNGSADPLAAATFVSSSGAPEKTLLDSMKFKVYFPPCLYHDNHQPPLLSSEQNAREEVKQNK